MRCLQATPWVHSGLFGVEKTQGMVIRFINYEPFDLHQFAEEPCFIRLFFITSPRYTMSQGFTSQMARNIFYGGSLFFILVFIGLVFHTETTIPERSKAGDLTESAIRGKHLWETRNCIGCHSLLGEGAYFAPELGNVYKRRGGDEGGGAFIKAWMKAMPTGAPGRRQMPQFNLTDQQLDDLVEFLKWTSEVNTEHWPPNIEG